ncbi:MAG: malonyl-CoA synthase [Pseudomonadota bacterium]
MANPLYDTLFGRHATSDAEFLRPPDAQSLSYRAFVARVAQIAHVLVEAGLRAGDRLAAQVEKSPEALMVYAACAQAGIIFLPLNTGYRAGELSYFIENSGARLVIVDPAREAEVTALAERAGAAVLTLSSQGQGSLMARADEMPGTFETVPREPGDLAAFLYTSGTTGRSKGAMLTQNNLLSNAQILAEYWRFSAADCLLHALPIFHTHGLFVATNIMLVVGGRMIFLPKFDIDSLIEALPQATTLMGVPTFYTRLLADPRFTRAAAAHMRLFVSGSAPLLAETHAAFEARTGHRILERYGMTETNMNTSNPYDGERRAGTVGFALPGVALKVTSPDTGEALPQGEIGQIEVKGENVFKGYWGMPEKTAAELREDGFFKTGDLGRIDPDGYVQIVGREKDLIISGGFNIYPKEIEALLDEQPGVLESAVIGVPHADFGETPLALLVPKAGETPDLGVAKASVSATLARFKHPRDFIVIPELPRNAMGKVQKNLLRVAYRDHFARPES